MKRRKIKQHRDNRGHKELCCKKSTKINAKKIVNKYKAMKRPKKHI